MKVVPIITNFKRPIRHLIKLILYEMMIFHILRNSYLLFLCTSNISQIDLYRTSYEFKSFSSFCVTNFSLSGYYCFGVNKERLLMKKTSLNSK